MTGTGATAALPSLRAWLTRQLVVVALVQAGLAAIALLALLAWAQDRASREDGARIAAGLGFASERLLQPPMAAIDQLARFAGGPAGRDPRALGEAMDATLAANPGFLTLMAVDAEGAIALGRPEQRGADGRSAWAGRYVGDRPYFLRALERGTVGPSPAFQGRGFGRDLIVGVSAPVRAADGAPAPPVAVVQGSLAVAAYEASLREVPLTPGAQWVLADDAGMVVARSEGIALPTLEPLPDALRGEADGLAGQAGVELPDVLGRGTHIRTTHTTAHGWTVVALVPVTRALAGLGAASLIALAMVALVAAVFLAIAWQLGRRLGEDGRRMARRLARLDLQGDAALPPLGEPRFAEAADLIDAQAALAERLRAGYRELKETERRQADLQAALAGAMERKEDEVQARTSLLETSARELRRLQQRLQDAERIGGVGTWRWDRESSAMRVSGSAQRLLDAHWLDDSVVLDVLLGRVDAAHRERVGRALREAIGGQGALALEFPIEGQPGRWLLMRGAHGSFGGADDWAFRGTLLDISERRAGEQRLAALATRLREVADLSAANAGAEDRIDGFRALAGRLLGAAAPARLLLEDADDGWQAWTSGGELLDAEPPACVAMLPGDGVPRLEAGGAQPAVWLALARGEQRIALGVEGLPGTFRLDAEAADMLRTLARLIDAELEQASSTRQLEAARDDATAANRTKSQVLAALSHEIWSPLAGMTGAIEALVQGMGGPLTPAQAKLLGGCLDTGRGISGMIGELIEAAKMESGVVPMRFGEVRASALCEAAIARVAAGAAARRHDLRLRVDVDPVLSVDRERMVQVLANLLGNAVKYTPDGGVVRLRVGRSPRRGHLRFAVLDNGPGIGPAERQRLLQPFTRGTSAGSRPGWGLGLSTVEMLVRLHDAHLTIHGREGRGSRFCVDVPVAPRGHHATGDDAGAPHDAHPARPSP